MTTPSAHPNFLTIPEAAKYCGVSRNTLYTWVRAGKLGSYTTPGRTNLIRPSDLVNFMQSNGMFVPDTLLKQGREDEKLSQETRPADASPSHLPSVLVVDDDSSSRMLATRLLKDHATVHQAETGFEALHLLTKHHDIDLVILDLRMPGQNGEETLREVHRLAPNVRVAVVTGFADRLETGAGQTTKVDVVIQKPLTLATLPHLLALLPASSASS